MTKITGAVYEVRTHGSVRGMRREPHPTRFVKNVKRSFGIYLLKQNLKVLTGISNTFSKKIFFLLNVLLILPLYIL